MRKITLKFVLQIIGVVIFFPLAVSAINTTSSGFRVNNGDTNTTIDAWGTCQKVTNTSGKNYFVPTKTSAEWLAFRSHLPSGVTLSSCSTDPSGIYLSIGGNNYSYFYITWSAGAGNGGAGNCKLQYNNGASWYDITSASSMNCDAISNGYAGPQYTLPADGWKSNWNGTNVRIVRKSDSVVVGTFAQTLVCSSVAGSGSPTSWKDENCNGYWDDSSISYGCPSGQYCYNAWIYSDSNCSVGGYLEGMQCVGEENIPYMEFCDPGCVGTSCYRFYESGCASLEFYTYY